MSVDGILVMRKAFKKNSTTGCCLPGGRNFSTFQKGHLLFPSCRRSHQTHSGVYSGRVLTQPKGKETERIDGCWPRKTDTHTHTQEKKGAGEKWEINSFKYALHFYDIFTQ